MAASLSIRPPRVVIAPDWSIADAAGLALATGLAAVKHYESDAVSGEIESVHQMRVSVRRLRATIRLFATVIHGSRRRVYERELKWLGQAAGAVRDCDVMAELIRDCGASLDPTLAEALTPVIDALAAHRNAEHSRFVGDLRTKRYAAICARLADPLLRRALPATDVGCYAPAMIAPITRKVRKAGKRIAAADAPPPFFHCLRVRVKRLRYGVEMLTEMGGKRSRKALTRLEQMQELLGAHQDMVATMAWLRAYAASAPNVAPETLMAVGAMVQMLVERRQKLAAQAYRRWRKVARSAVINDALDELSRLAQKRLEAARQAQADAEGMAQAAIVATGDAQPDVPANYVAAEAVTPDRTTPAMPAPLDEASAVALADAVESTPAPHHHVREAT
jgi:CHAD domain-containing protein